MTSRQPPEHLPAHLDLRQPPSVPQHAVHYSELVQHLERLGKFLERGGPDRDEMRRWEETVLPLLRDSEIDMLMFVPADEEFVIGKLPERRWNNLRRILLRRKGFSMAQRY